MKKLNKICIVGQEYNRQSALRANFHSIAKEFNKIADLNVLVLRSKDEPNNPIKINTFSKSNRLFTMLFFFILSVKLRLTGVKIFFIHQGGVYPLLLLPLKLSGVKIYQWKAHPTKDLSWLFFQLLITNMVFTVSKSSYPPGLRKPRYIGHGVSFPIFTVDHERFLHIRTTSKVRICFAGRISESKNCMEMIDFVRFLAAGNPNLQFTFDLLGPYDSSTKYYQKLRSKIYQLNLSNMIVKLHGPVSREEVFDYYAMSLFSLNFTNTALDKSLVEAVYSGCIVLSNNPNYIEGFDVASDYDLYKEKSKDLIDTANHLIDNPQLMVKISTDLSSEARQRYLLKSWVNKILLNIEA